MNLWSNWDRSKNKFQNIMWLKNSKQPKLRYLILDNKSNWKSQAIWSTKTIKLWSIIFMLLLQHIKLPPENIGTNNRLPQYIHENSLHEKESEYISRSTTGSCTNLYHIAKSDFCKFNTLSNEKVKWTQKILQPITNQKKNRANICNLTRQLIRSNRPYIPLYPQGLLFLPLCGKRILLQLNHYKMNLPQIL